MNDIPLTLQEQLKPLFFKKDIFSDKLCANGKEIRKIRLELMKRGEPQGSPSAEQIFDLRLEGASKETLLRSQRLIEETIYLTAKLRALEREIDGVLTQEILVTAGCPEGAASAEQIDRLASKSLICDQTDERYV